MEDKEPQNDPVTELDIQLSKDYYVQTTVSKQTYC